MVCLRKLKLAILQHTLMVILAIALASTLGCDPATEPNWVDVTGFSQIDGTWKASPSVAYKTQGMNITLRFYNCTVAIDSTAKTMTTSGTRIATFSGDNVNWASIKEAENLASMAEQEGIAVIFNDANHSYSIVYDNFAEQLSDEDLKRFSIPDYGEQKLKLYFNDEGSYEVIFTKI